MGLSTAGIGQGLSSSSMNPIQGVSYRSAVPQAYTVENQSDFSDAFVESMRSLSSTDAVEGAAPVQYSTATVMTRHIGQIEASQRSNEGYNTIAAGFEGRTVGYGAGAGATTGYGMVGSHIDLFA